jgi:putative tricarboxylic transport membrane protein
MERKEWVLVLGMFLIGVIFVIEALRLGLGSVHRPGPGFLPFYGGLLLSIISFFSLIKSFFTAPKGSGKERVFAGSILKVVAIVVSLIIYILIIPWLGYLLSTFMLLLFLFKAGGFRKWAFILAAAFLSVCMSYLLFSYWLGMRFPKGFLGL